MKFAQPMPDGTVTIHALAPKVDIERALGPLSDAAYRAHFFERNGLKEEDVTEIPDNWTPPDGDRAFRNAWVMNAGRVEVDMPKAREVMREKMRAARVPLLDALDADYLRADETGDAATKATVTARKQALRDVTAIPAIDSARTPDELKAAWPRELGASPYARRAVR